jgi:Putative amidoligase enzyme
MGRDGLDEVTAACRALCQLGARVNRTCGFHAHFDARDLSTDHVRRICLNYLRLEPLIDTLMAPSRRANTNQYCRSIRRDGTEARLRNATTMQELGTALNDHVRYYKLNLQAYFDHGTIEFRQHHGTIEVEKVTFWLRFLHCLIDYSALNDVPATFAETPATLAAFCPTDVVTYFTRRQQALAA